MTSIYTSIEKVDKFVENNEMLFVDMKIPEHPPNRENIQKWLDQHKDTIQYDMAKIFANNIFHVSFTQMVTVINHMVNELYELKELSNKDLYLYVPMHQDKSNFYFTMFFYWLCKLKEIKFTGVLSHFYKNYDFDYVDCLIIIVDDASYSGIQIVEHISNLSSNRGELFLAIPYISETARARIHKTNDKAIIPSSSTIFYSVKQLLVQHNLSVNIRKSVNRSHLLYFDFKLPDSVSIPQTIFVYGYRLFDKSDLVFTDPNDVLPLINGCDETYRKTIVPKYSMDVNDEFDIPCPNPFYKKLVWKHL
jgi:hypothetical protein